MHGCVSIWVFTLNAPHRRLNLQIQWTAAAHTTVFVRSLIRLLKENRVGLNCLANWLARFEDFIWGSPMQTYNQNIMATYFVHCYATECSLICPHFLPVSNSFLKLIRYFAQIFLQIKMLCFSMKHENIWIWWRTSYSEWRSRMNLNICGIRQLWTIAQPCARIAVRAGYKICSIKSSFERAWPDGDEQANIWLAQKAWGKHLAVLKTGLSYVPFQRPLNTNSLLIIQTVVYLFSF